MSAKFTARVVKNVDPQKLMELVRRFDAENKAVNVGFPGGIAHESDSGQPSELTVAQIATVHEFGSPEHNIPERPFLRPAIYKNEQRYKQLNRDSLLKVLRGKLTITQALGRLGDVAKFDVQKEIRGGDFAPLAPATIKRKGSSKPLIDSGQMIQSVQWEFAEDD